MSSWRKPSLAAAAALAGASGLGLEVLFLSMCGLSLGYGRAGPIGLAVFVAGWALGARIAGAWTRPLAPSAVGAGAIVLGAALAFPPALVAAGARAPGGTAAAALSGAAILAVALPQGAFLPWLARGWRAGRRAGLAALVCANLAGAAAGAWLLGEVVPEAVGRIPAAVTGGLIALAAGGLAAAALRGLPVSAGRGGGAPADPPPPPSTLGTAGGAGRLQEEREEAPASGAIAASTGAGAPPRGWIPPLDFPLAGILLAYLTGFGLTCQWIGLRLGVLWFGGMQHAIGAVLVASLAALALGAAAAPGMFPRGPRSVPALIFACCASSGLLLVAHVWLERVPATWPELARAFLLVGPALIPFGAAVPVLHRELEAPSARGLGRLLGWEAAGALVGIPLSHFVLVPRFGLTGAVAVWTALALPVFLLLLLPRFRHVALLGAAGAVVLAAIHGGRLTPDPALASPPLANPALRVLAFDEDEHFAVAVVEDGLLGERTLMTDGFRAAGTGESYRYMRALGHLPLLLHPAPRRVAVLAFGTGTTAGAVSLHAEVERLEVLELSRAVADYAPWFEEVNRGVLDGGEGRGRVLLRLGDGRRALAEEVGSYEVVSMEPLLPSSPFAVYLYTAEFYRRAKLALAPGGLLCQWVPPHALRPDVFEAVVAAFTGAFEWSGLWLFGTQLVLIGGEAAPELDPRRFEGAAGELAEDLASLGIDAPAGVAARFVGSGSAWPAVERPLTDADPWIVHPRLPPGRTRLALLPRNLALLRRRATDPPASWLLGLGPQDLALADAAAALRRAREAFATEQLDLAGVDVGSESLVRGLEGELDEARRLAPHDPEVAAFAREVELARARREGLTLLALDRSAAGGRRALDPLLRCAELAPERADAHLYVAVALERAGELPAAAAALGKAMELCPGLAATPPAEQARALGFPASDELAMRFHVVRLPSPRRGAPGG